MSRYCLPLLASLALATTARAAEHDKTHEAWQLLIKIDARYGGLAQPDSVELAQRIGEQH
jgi:hypothetical protein